MAPLLLDSRDLLKLGLASIFTLVLIFAAGYFLGHQRASVFYQAGTEEQALSLPDKAVLVEDAVDSQIPTIIAAGENIDVDQAEKVTQKNNASQGSSVALAKDMPIETLENTALQNPKDKISDVNKTVVQTTAVVDVNELTSEQLNEIKYSVQVGMYGRLLNAENMMKMLQAQQFDAYVTDYSNKNNETRYNVRFGYFSSKKSALSKLKEFKEKQNGDGYLVKFSAANIVNVAEAININAVSDIPTTSDVRQKENNEEIQIPVSVSFDATETEISSTDISQADVLADTQITSN